VVRISVTDTGMGISPENLEYIWDRYFKENKAHKRAVVGTGLGLSIVKGILQMHNARFGVETSEAEENHGSTFWFELPCTDAPAKTE
jgi:signal transduction histidine kinase